MLRRASGFERDEWVQASSLRAAKKYWRNVPQLLRYARCFSPVNPPRVRGLARRRSCEWETGGQEVQCAAAGELVGATPSHRGPARDPLSVGTLLAAAALTAYAHVCTSCWALEQRSEAAVFSVFSASVTLAD